MFHWRRGDQLTTRCFYYGEKSDRVNCGSPDNFVKFVKATFASLGVDAASIVTYVATNERNASSIAVLRREGYKLFGDISAGMGQQFAGGANLTSLDAFMTELTLICDADYFVVGKTSEIHKMSYRCRSSSKPTVMF